MKKKLLKGSIATYIIIDGTSITAELNPLEVLRYYKTLKDVPKKWTNARLAELGAAIEWAINEIPPEVIETQDGLENLKTM